MAGAERAPQRLYESRSYFQAPAEREPIRYEAAPIYDQRRNNEQVDRMAGVEGRTEAMAPTIRITPSSFVPERSKLTALNLIGTALTVLLSVAMIGFSLYALGTMAVGAAAMGAFVGKLLGWFGLEMFTMVNPLIFKMLIFNIAEIFVSASFALYFIGLSMARIHDAVAYLYGDLKP